MSEYEPEIAKCTKCGYSAHPDRFNTSFTPYHDLKCPKCGTTEIDTTLIKKAWSRDGLVYHYGENNTLVLDRSLIEINQPK